MNPIPFITALGLGFIVRQIGLPPMIGFLGAGFLLDALGQEASEALPYIADLGVTLLLFTIGCKLDLRSLLKPQIWATTSIHMLATVVLFGGVVFALSTLGLERFVELDFKLAMLIGFALSFSSTVFAVKVLEERGEMDSRHGQIAIGILIMQDIVAVVFLAVSSGKVPSVWAIGLLGLPLLRPVLLWLLKRIGHGELLILAGIMLTWGGSNLFESLNLKGDLGAIVAGVLIAGHPKASEVAKSLFSIKDIFLVGFFLSIGYEGTPDLAGLVIAVMLVAFVPIKVAFFFGLLTRFDVRARTALLSSFSLANYSEFGLIVTALAVKNGWISSTWLVIDAIAVAISFVAASPLNVASNRIYTAFESRLKRFQRPGAMKPVDLGDARIVIFGMGRVGTGAYDALRLRDREALGIDTNADVVLMHTDAGRQVVLGDPTDVEFLEAVALDRLKLVMLSLPVQTATLAAVDFLRSQGYGGRIVATARFDDEVTELETHGVSAFNLFGEAGLGFAEHSRELLDED